MVEETEQKDLLEKLLQKWSVLLGMEDVEIITVIRDDLEVLDSGSCAESTVLLDFHKLSLVFGGSVLKKPLEQMEDIVIHELMHYKVQPAKSYMFDLLDMFRPLIPPYQREYLVSQVVKTTEDVVMELTSVMMKISNEKAT